ncbi:hypothetical protein Aca07nite_69130 [Actinoplanes capillaceus]|uniref:Uncharacterized protein n=1 Tax=Actinoplanes campanulatus TaxID=113559 RepID=A0ABQ3WTY0_9ACTN|nr:hypothetical protein [Actinoplanes capillaceus]GID49638.1 hypothetical protein Aca07nite_69130 [Actinoplanes capillaceus]
MDVFFVVVLLGPGALISGFGLAALLTGGELVLSGSRRAWRDRGQAIGFCLLLGTALLTSGLTEIATRTGLIGDDARLWLLLPPVTLTTIAIVAFRPRRPTTAGADA